MLPLYAGCVCVSCCYFFFIHNTPTDFHPTENICVIDGYWGRLWAEQFELHFLFSLSHGAAIFASVYHIFLYTVYTSRTKKTIRKHILLWQRRAGPAPMLDLHLDSVLRLFNEPYFNFSRSFIRILRNDYMWGDLSWLFKPLKIAITRVCCVDGWPYVVHAITFIFLYAKETCCSILHLIQTVMAKIYILHLALALCHHQHSVQYESKNTISIQCGVFVFVLATDMRT